MGPQDALGALHRSKVHVVNCPASHFFAIQPKWLSRGTAELQRQASLSLMLPRAASVLPLPRERIRQQVLQAGLSESWAAGSAGKTLALEGVVGRKTGLKQPWIDIPPLFKQNWEMHSGTTTEKVNGWM